MKAAMLAFTSQSAREIYDQSACELPSEEYVKNNLQLRLPLFNEQAAHCKLYVQI
jgi:hypothetical protein|tara:strand:- start:471 stop:635 length:165 start_codon:yes stop_codon:yes gene_type:complete